MKYSTKGALLGAGLASVLTLGLARTAEANSLSPEEIRADRIEAISACVGVLSVKEKQFNEFPSECQEVREDIPYTLTETVEHIAGEPASVQAVGNNMTQAFVLPPSNVVKELAVEDYVEKNQNSDEMFTVLMIGLTGVSLYGLLPITGQILGGQKDRRLNSTPKSNRPVTT